MRLYDEQSWAEAKAALLEGLTPQKQSIVDQLLKNQCAYLRESEQKIQEVEREKKWYVRAYKRFLYILFKLKLRKESPYETVMTRMIRRIIPHSISTERVDDIRGR